MTGCLVLINQQGQAGQRREQKPAVAWPTQPLYQVGHLLLTEVNNYMLVSQFTGNLQILFLLFTNCDFVNATLLAMSLSLCSSWNSTHL